MRLRLRTHATVAWLLIGATVAAAQTVEPAPTLRVFLADGQALPSYGEPAFAGDRVIFMLPIGGGESPSRLQLMSLPASSVDTPRTARYTESVRAAHYAATRGELDYSAMTAEVSRSLDQLRSIQDPQRRLALAEEAKRRLISWSDDNYKYRAADIQVMAGLFDEVIASLRAAAGESRFSVDLVSGPAAPVREVLRPAPSLRESIELALVAAGAADVLADRDAVLRTALSVAAGQPSTEDLRLTLSRRVAEEAATDQAYSALSASVLKQAELAGKRDDIKALDALRSSVVVRDRALGSKRPDDLRRLLTTLDAAIAHARATEAALAHFAAVRAGLARYERRVRPLLTSLDSLAPVLSGIRLMKGPSFEALAPADARIGRLLTSLQRIKPPEDAQIVHATLVSGLQIARHAIGLRRQTAIAPNATRARDGSSAASGAEMLITQARADLRALLRPPKGS